MEHKASRIDTNLAAFLSLCVDCYSMSVFVCFFKGGTPTSTPFYYAGSIASNPGLYRFYLRYDIFFRFPTCFRPFLLRPLNRCIASKMCLRLTTKWHLNPYCFLFEGDQSHPQTFSYTAQLFLEGSFESRVIQLDTFFLPWQETGFCFSQALALAYVKVMPSLSPAVPPNRHKMAGILHEIQPPALFPSSSPSA